MSDTPRNTSRFITRDINYLIGGGCIVASFLYSFGLLYFNSGPAFLFAAGIAYVVGYAVHDWAGIVHLVSTVPVRQAPAQLQWLYRQLTQEQWNDVEDLDLARAEDKLQLGLQNNELAQFNYEKVISLMHVGTTMAPCCWISAALLLSKWIYGGRQLFDGALTAVALAFGLGFYYLGWLKNMQWAQRLAQPAQPKDKPRTQAESKPENKPRVQAKPKPEDTPREQVRPEVQAKPRQQDKPQTIDTPQAEAKPAGKDKPQAVSKPKEQDKPQADSKPKEQDRPQARVKPRERKKSQAKVKPQLKKKLKKQAPPKPKITRRKSTTPKRKTKRRPQRRKLKSP